MVLCTTLKPNGKFSGNLIMGSTKTEKESNTLSGSVISVVWLFVLPVILFVLNSAQSSGNNWNFH